MDGLKMTIWSKYFILHDILLILVLLCICLRSKNPLSKSFVKIGPSMLKKMAVLCQIKARGPLCCHAHIVIYFYDFLMPGIR